MSTRLPKWKQFHEQQQKKEKSVRSKSSRYTPKKSDRLSVEDSGFRQMVHNFSQHSIDLKQENVGARSVANCSISDKDNLRNSERQYKKTESFDGKTNSVRKEKKNEKEKIKIDFPLIASVQQMDNNQLQFKQYLKFIEKIQTKFQSQKRQIQKQLATQEQIIADMKNKLIEAYLPKKSSFKDKSLLIKSTKDQKRKPNTSTEPLSKAISQKKVPPLRDHLLERKDMRNRESEEKRGKSTDSWASNKFDKIFTTLNQMKTNLNECKKLRESKSPRKNIENKGNLVNTNQAKLKNKKSHE